MSVQNNLTTEAVSSANKRGSSRKIKYFLYGVVALMLLLVATGAIYQYIASAHDLRTYSPPGEFVEVNGHKMHFDCTGVGVGDSPTVILESGLNDSWLSWYKVQPAVANFARVCSYDRAGVGWSEAQSGEPDSQNIALTLHALLNRAGIKPPYILVGHSSGGLHVRVYQKMYPGDIMGLVLVDPSHPDEMNRLPEQIASGRSQRRHKFRLLALAMPLGIPRFTKRCGDGPAEIRGLLRTMQCRTQWMKTQIAEFDAFDKSADEARASGSLGTIPVVVISHDPKIGGRPGVLAPEVAAQAEIAWGQMQEELAHLSTNGQHVVAQGSAHYIQFDRPDLVISAIRQEVDAWKNNAAAKSQTRMLSESVDTQHVAGAGLFR